VLVLNIDDFNNALDFAKIFAKDYKKFQKDLDTMHENLRLLKDKLNQIDKCLRGKIEF